MVKDGLPKVAIVGPFTSVSMALIGQMTPVFNLLQVYPILNPWDIAFLFVPDS